MFLSAVGLCLLIVVNFSESLRCYKFDCVSIFCNSKKIETCGEKDTHCFKSTMKHVTVTRRHDCASQDWTGSLNVTKDECIEKMVVDPKSGDRAKRTVCFCNSDNCNLSVRSMGDFFKISVMLVLTLAFS